MKRIESLRNAIFGDKVIVEANGAPNPITKIISAYGYGDERPTVAFKDKIYYHSISPQIQVGVMGYARLLDLGNIMVNTDDEASKKLIEDWIDNTNFKEKLENMGNTFLICGNSILEKLDEGNTRDVAEVDMNTIVDKKRDEFGTTLHYIQQTIGGQTTLGEGKMGKYIEFNLNTISRQAWSPCIFESAAIPRQVGNRVTRPLVELVVAMEDAMSTIILNNAYPEVYYTFENVGEEELKKQTEKIRKRKPGDRMIGTKHPKIEMFEAKGQSAYVDYIKYLYTSLELAVKFPVGILTGDFTSRASSDTTSDLTVKLANAIKRYIASKLKNELFDPILDQSGLKAKTANLQITFGTQEIIKLLPQDVLSRVSGGMWTKEEGREWDKDNAGVDLFDDDVIKQNTLDAKAQMMQKPVVDPQLELKKKQTIERAEEIKDNIFSERVEKGIHERISLEVEKIKESIEDKRFNKKVKEDLIKTLDSIQGGTPVINELEELKKESYRRFIDATKTNV